jgi:uncharacterized protein YfaP (DUF2135 family)
MSNNTQSSNHHKEHAALGHAPMLLPTTTIATSVVPRILTLLAAISLAAFAFYITRPEANISSVRTSDHASRSENQQITSPAASSSASSQSQSQSSGGSNKSTVTVNGKNIPVPADGNLDQTIQDGDSTTTVRISSESSGDSSSSVHVESHSSSSSSDGGT